MKPLLPTLKEKKRYIVYELLTEHPLKGRPEQEVLAHLRTMLGLFDGAKAGILPVRYDEKSQTGILRCATNEVDKVKASFLLLRRVNGVPVIPRVIGVSGILKKTERFMPGKRTAIKNIMS